MLGTRKLWHCWWWGTAPIRSALSIQEIGIGEQFVCSDTGSAYSPGFLGCFIHCVSLSSYSKLSKSLAQPLANKHIFHAKLRVERHCSFKVYLVSCLLKLLPGKISLLCFPLWLLFSFLVSDIAPRCVLHGCLAGPSALMLGVLIFCFFLINIVEQHWF